MNRSLSTQDKLLLVFGVIVGFLLVIVIGLFFFRSSQQKNMIPTVVTPTPIFGGGASSSMLRIVSIDPQDGSQNISSYSTFSVVFNKPITSDEVNVSFLPTTNFTQRIDGNTLYVDATTLQDDTQYTLTVSHKNGQNLAHFSFKTAPSNSSIYQDTTGQNVDAWTKMNRPDVAIFNNIPYSSADFSIAETSVATAENYAFTVTLLGADKNAAKQAFLGWLKNTVGLTDDEIAKVSIQYQ